MTTFDAVKPTIDWERTLAEYGLSADKRKHDCPQCGERKFKRSEKGFGCDGCGLKGTNPIDYVAVKKGLPANEVRDHMATVSGVTSSRKQVDAPKLKKRILSSPVAKELALDGYSKHNATFEPIAVLDKFAPYFVLRKPPVTVESLKLAGATCGQWKQFANSRSSQNVIGIPTYGPNLDLVNWSMYSATGGKIQSRQKVEENGEKKWITEQLLKRSAFSRSDRVGIFLSLAARELVLAGQPIEGLKILKLEGGSDFLAMVDRIPTDEKWIVTSSSFGCRWSDEINWLIPLLAKIEPIQCIVVPDCDLAGIAGASDWARELSAIAPTKVLQLPFEIGTKKDVRDFLNAGNGFAELQALIDSTAVFNPDGHPKTVQIKRAQHIDGPVGDATGEEGNDSFDQIANFESIEVENEDGSKSKVDIPIPILEIAESIFEHSDGWPKRVGNELFVLHNEESRQLKKPSSLFAWLRESIQVEWKQAPKLPTKEEIFEIVLHSAERFDSVERFPHFPPIPGVFYACEDRPPGNGEHLEQFLDFFCPSTPIDRQLLLAAIATTFWGGPPGGRPGFQFAALTGQGAGKTTTAATIAKLSGGSIDFDQGCKREEITKRLLSGETGYRVVLLDNIKAQTFSSASFESLITSKSISGHQMYSGNASKPNHFAFFVTFNSANFSRDMAQRLVSIVLGDAIKSADWQTRLDTFIAENHENIIDDVKAFFEKPKEQLSKYNRWANWQGEIVSRLNDPESVIEELATRETANDGDAKMAADVREFIAEFLLGYHYQTPYKVHIRFPELAKIVSGAIGSPHTSREAGLLIDRFIGSGLIDNMQRNPCKSYGKGYSFWSVDAEKKNICYELANRIEILEIEDDNAKEKRRAKARKEVY